MAITPAFTDAEISRIAEQGMIYMCACPAQVAAELRNIRQLIAYQQGCLSNSETNATVHEVIAKYSEEAHAVLERCLAEVLEIEGWNRQTLEMPEGLRELRDRLLDE